MQCPLTIASVSLVLCDKDEHCEDGVTKQLGKSMFMYSFSDDCVVVFFLCLLIEKEQQEAIEHIDEVQNEIDR